MSAVVLLGAGVTLLVFPGLLRPISRRVPPAPWTVAVAVSLAGGLLVLELGLVLLALPTVLTATGFSGFADACTRMLHLVDRLPTPVSWLGAGLAVALPALAVRAGLDARHVQRVVAAEPWLGVHTDHGDYELVVLPTRQPLAFNVTSQRPQIVLSAGLADSLPSAQLSAIVRHEAAHLRHRHDRYLLLARALDASLSVIPGVGAGTAALRTGLERWADEEAAPTPSARSTVLDALVQVGRTILVTAVPQFGPADTIAERVDALGRDRATTRAPLLLVSVTLAVFFGVALVSFANWVGMTRTMLAAVGYCPS